MDLKFFLKIGAGQCGFMFEQGNLGNFAETMQVKFRNS